MIKFNSRAAAEKLMFSILDPLKTHYSNGKAQLPLGSTSAHYPDTSAWMEGFSRPLWALGAFWGGGGEEKLWEEIYLQGLISGTDPENPEYWGECSPYDQRLVEMAAIAFTMLWTKDKLIGRMSEKQKNNLCNWLRQINTNACCDCNWRFFHVLVNVALKKAGEQYDHAGMEESLEFLDRCYVGDGWYRDGIDGMTDYYIPFAMHFYGLLYSIFMKDEDPERCQQFVDRAMIFGKEFIYWFAEDGSALPYGRSMIYRFAQVSFFSACVMAHIEPLPLGVMKGIIERHLDYWLHKPIFDRAGILTIGYCYPNQYMTESYNSPGSPYWAMKAFAFLTMPENDPFWSTESLPMPKLDKLKLLTHANMLVQRTDDGHVTAYPAGLLTGHVHTHMEEKYSKFAYSTKYGFSVSVAQINLWESAPDSSLCFEMDEHIFIRRTIDSFTVLSDRIITEWSPFIGIRVSTEVIPTADGHRRIHTIDSDYDCIAYDSGFAEPSEQNNCTVKILQGDGELFTIWTAPNTNLICSKTKIPSAKFAISKGRTVIETEFAEIQRDKKTYQYGAGVIPAPFSC